jgi:hypothetical protein
VGPARPKTGVPNRSFEGLAAPVANLPVSRGKMMT